MEYAVDPADPTHVVMTSYGIVGSTDSGQSWHVVLHSKVMFGPIAFASGISGVAYAVGFDGSLWKSSDQGHQLDRGSLDRDFACHHRGRFRSFVAATTEAGDVAGATNSNRYVDVSEHDGGRLRR